MKQLNSPPAPPKISEEDLEKCRRSNDYCPVLFEWYKYVGALSNFYAYIQLESPAIRSIPEIHYYVLVGLLNRCSRLMLSNIVLSHEGAFGETTSIIDRCIFESAIKVSWLTHHNNPDSFNRIIADGLKTELEFKATIKRAIEEREDILGIEKRMLDSIEKHIKSSNLSEDDIKSAKKLPDMAIMIESIGQDRLLYIAMQKIGSHHIHGTWPSLRLHYLVEEDGVYQPQDHGCGTHENQYIFIPLMVLRAMIGFVEFICDKQEDIDAFTKLPNAVIEEIMKINDEVIGSDFDPVREV